ncbi:glutathione-regulated potassium-efflux system oxidoreductase KefF [Winogradskyella sediminis]|uniref:Glutathione-regulated potassium-efflux system ancillary protein KefG n=1 Tax=Winogradskyella sediminis TaxID=1382466 RepID=A0A1H1XIC9_9FLAO|nr:NAD(P)H-dependent oxidoreductase [Winogradskyella sediminis]SDT09008.1 glutathione-regulated potassium-efflux system ancillary protein KefG [Winogradskyella sediminis]
MKKILIIFSHPKLEKSRANRSLIEHIRGKDQVTIHDLYEEYPDFHIDVPREQQLLEQHDIIIWHHPFYWYSCPPLMKQWIDMVLEFNWAYGPKGKALHNKICLNAITTGGSKEVYCSSGYNSFTVEQFLRPFEQTSNLCGMTYFPPFAVMGTHSISDEVLHNYKISYGKLIDLLQADLSLQDFEKLSFINDIPQLKTT